MDVHVHTLRTRFHVPRHAGGAGRLQSAVQEAAGEALERALEYAGIREDDIVCLRTVHTRVRVRLDSTDESIGREWALALAGAIREAARRGPSGIAVRYESRRQALIDCAVGVAHEDYRRAWAWRQAGFWSIGDTPSVSEAIDELVRILGQQERALPSLFCGAAFAPVLQRLAPRFRLDHWAALAAAALEGASIPGFQAALQSSEIRDNGEILARRHPAAGILREAAQQQPECAVPIASLIVSGLEPALVSRRGAESARSIAAVSLWLAGATDPRADSSAGPDPTAHKSQPAASQPGKIERATPLPRASRKPPSSEESAGERPVPDIRRRAVTAYGGLLFLLPLLESLKIVDDFLALENRPFRWTLHQFAMTLLPLHPDDPAALAFAGLQPDAEPPSRDEAQPSPEESELLARSKLRLIDSLREMLPGRVRLDGDSLLQFVCMRHAEVVADPGWIEIHLPLQEVSTEIRKAGLDLNLEFLWWLGVVVRFVYE